MRVRNVARGVVLATTLAMLAAMLPGTSVAAPSGGAKRYLVVAKSAADYGALRAKAVREGARVLRELPQVKALVVRGSASTRKTLAADSRTLGVASDHVARVAVEDPLDLGKALGARAVVADQADPAPVGLRAQRVDLGSKELGVRLEGGHADGDQTVSGSLRPRPQGRWRRPLAHLDDAHRNG